MDAKYTREVAKNFWPEKCKKFYMRSGKIYASEA